MNAPREAEFVVRPSLILTLLPLLIVAAALIAGCGGGGGGGSTPGGGGGGTLIRPRPRRNRADRH